MGSLLESWLNKQNLTFLVIQPCDVIVTEDESGCSCNCVNEGRTVEHLKKEMQQKGDIGLVAEVLYSVVSFQSLCVALKSGVTDKLIIQFVWNGVI